MPVTNEHEQYVDFKEDWQEVRDCVQGNRVIKRKGTQYLPMLSGMTDKEYQAYRAKVKFFGATGRALDGLHGNIFSKCSIQTGEVSDAFVQSLEDVDLMGTNIDQFVSDLIDDCLQTNWGAILVDYIAGDEVVSQLDAKKAGLKAYLRYFPAEQFINWDYSTVGGQTKLSLAVLVEPYTESLPNDMFDKKTYKKYRVLYLDKNGHYYQKVYDEKIGLSIPSEPIPIKINGKPMTEIPLFPVPGKVPEKSMLYDLAQLNIQHYQDSADYNNGKHYTSIPTAVAINLSPEIDEATGKPVPTPLGGKRILYFPNENGVPGADVKYLEFSGNGLRALSDGINHVERQMAILGAHIIAAEKRGVETAEALRIHRMGENGVLAAFTRNISDQVSKALRIKGLWDGESFEALEKWQIMFNTDYDLSQEDTRTLTAILQGRSSGELPKMSLYIALRNLNLIPEQWDFDTFLLEVERDNVTALPPMEDEQEPADPVEDDESNEQDQEDDNQD